MAEKRTTNRSAAQSELRESETSNSKGQDRRRRWKRPSVWIGWVVFFLFAVVGVRYAWQQIFIYRIEQNGGHVDSLFHLHGRDVDRIMRGFSLHLLVELPSSATDEEVRRVTRLWSVKGLLAWNTGITDTGLEYVGRLHGLQRLRLDNTRITDAGLPYLRDLDKLSKLNLQNTRITDEGLKHLGELKGLEHLEINDTELDGSGLKHLRSLAELKSLILYGTNVSADAIGDLRKRRPELRIGWSIDQLRGNLEDTNKRNLIHKHHNAVE